MEEQNKKETILLLKSKRTFILKSKRPGGQNETYTTKKDCFYDFVNFSHHQYRGGALYFHPVRHC
jgi:hypothetical protein